MLNTPNVIGGPVLLPADRNRVPCQNGTCHATDFVREVDRSQQTHGGCVHGMPTGDSIGRP
jgi:hypothetical protein